MDFSKSVKGLKNAFKNVGDIDLSILPNSEQNYIEWSEVLVGLLFFPIRDLKKLRKPFKETFNCLYKESQSVLEQCLIRKLKDVFFSESPDEGVPFFSLSFLLEDCQFTRHLLAVHLPQIFSRVAKILQNELSHPTSIDEQSEICGVLKIVVQSLQYLKHDIAHHMAKSDNAFQNLVSIGNSCLTMLKNSEEFAASIRSMCSILMGHLLNYDQQDASVAILMTNLTFSEEIFKVSGPLSPLQVNPSDQQSTEGLYEIFLLKGFFSCTRFSAFICTIEDDKEKTFLNLSFEIIIRSLVQHGQLQYHGFQVLKLWWTKAQQITKFNELKLTEDIFLEDGIYVQKSLKVLFSNWDSPISGVPAIVLEIFNIVVKCLRKISRITPKESPLLKKLVNDLIKLSTSVKGKYDFISVLVEELGAQLIVRDYPEFLKGITPLLAVNHLCPTISRTYKTVLTSIMKSGDADDLWGRILVPGLMEALLSHDPAIRINASIYWLPVHLKKVPCSYVKLMAAVNKIRQEEDCLLAEISISKVARRQNLICIQDVEERIMQSSFESFNDTIRAEAFLLVCCNTKLSQEISSLEMELIRTYLPLNMNSDSAVFRQQLVYAIKCLTERIRDSLGCCEKKESSAKNQVELPKYKERCEEMVTFLLTLCAQSLHRSYSYQRKKSAIDILSTLFTTLIEREKLSVCVDKLQSEENWKVLIDLLLDNVPEIRSQSLDLLVKCFPSLEEDALMKQTSLACSLCISPRAQDGEKGAAVFEYVFSANCKREGNLPMCISVLKNIIHNLELEVYEMKKNILAASRKNPVHGWMLALAKCLESITEFHKFNELRESIVGISNLMIDVIKYILRTVFGCIEGIDGGKKAEGEEDEKLGTSADFCKMTDRINRLVIDNRDTEATNDSVLLSEDHEAVLAACWLCLLRGGSLLSVLSKIVARTVSNSNTLAKICNCFVLILTSCRHRGAIEGCFESFLSTCKTLLSSPVNEYRNIPSQIISDVCDGLLNHSQSGSNVTRRSAGIPLVIEAVVVAEVSLRKDKLFHKVMKAVITLSEGIHCLEPQDSDEKFDLPQIHGLYILKHLFRNSQLGCVALLYAADVLQIAIKCLSSPIWVVRNAATHLFGAVVSRVVGQKNIDGANVDSLEGSVSSSEFFSRFPEIVLVILEELKSSNTEKSQRWILPKPGVHPVLTMLSKLTYGKHDPLNKSSRELVKILETLLGSPVYSVRCMAAKSLIGLTSYEEAFSTAANFLNVWHDDSFPNSNVMHGSLVLLNLVSTTYTLKSSQAKMVLQNILRILTTWTLHPLVANECLEILRNYRDLLASSATFIRYAKGHLISIQTDITAGRERYLKTLADVALEVMTLEDTLPLFRDLITSNVPCQQKAALDWARKGCHNPAVRSDIIKTLAAFLIMIDPNEIKGESVEVLCDCIELWACIPSPELEVSLNDSLCRLALGWASRDSPLSLRCSCMALLSSVLVQIDSFGDAAVTADSTQHCVIHWTDVVCMQTSFHEASEPLRLCASRCLEVAGSMVLPRLHKINIKKYGELLCAILSLLHDEQPEIRLPACSFVTKMVRVNGRGSNFVLHQNIATKEFLALVVFKHSTCESQVLDTVFEYCIRPRIPGNSNSNHALLFDKEPFNLYEEPVQLSKTVEQTFLDWLNKHRSSISPAYIRRKLEKASLEAEKISSPQYVPGQDFLSLQCLSIYIRMLLQAAIIAGLQHVPSEGFLKGLAKTAL